MHHARDPILLRTISHRGFTLLEVIVVIVIVGLLAGIAVPRMVNVGQRQAELEAKAVRTLLSVAAEKAEVSHRPVAVDYSDESKGADPQSPRLTLWVMNEDAKATTDSSGAARVKWERDRLSEVVELSRLKIATATSDGGVLTSGKWRVVFTPGQPRPSLEIKLEPVFGADGPTWVVSLPPDESGASLGTSDGLRGAVTSPARTIDLDDTGKGESKW